MDLSHQADNQLAGHTSPAGDFLDYVFMVMVSFLLMHELFCIRQRLTRIAGQVPRTRSPVVLVTHPVEPAMRIAQPYKLKNHPTREHRNGER